MVVFLSFTVSLIVLFQKRRNQFKIAILNKENEFLQALQSSQIEIQEQTLRNISQELHDNISQQLGLVKIQLTLLETSNPSIKPSKQVIAQSIEDLRAMSKSLHPDRIASIPLKDNVLLELDRLKKIPNLNIVFDIQEDPDPLPVETRIVVFRIFQELTNNVLKHAEATEIKVTLIYLQNQLQLTVTDNGKGLPDNFEEGIGFLSIKNRVSLLNGHFALSKPQLQGTQAMATVPVL